MKFAKLLTAMLAAFVALSLLMPGAAALSVVITPSSPGTIDNIYCATDEDPGAYIYKWFKGGSLIKQGSVLESSYTAKGETWECRAYLPPSPPYIPNEILVGSSNVVIVNSPPAVQSIIFTGEPYYANSTISVSASAFDADGDSMTLYYVFENNSAVLQNSTSSTFDCSGSCSRGDVINVSAIAFDGSSYSSAVSIQTTIINSVPYGVNITWQPVPVYVNSTINVSAVALDVDMADSPTYEYKFYDINTSTVLQDYSGDNTFLVTVAQSRHLLSVYVNASDGEGSAEGIVNISIANSPPSWNIGDLSWNQDTILEINLSQNASDLDDDSLTFSASSVLNITISISGSNATFIPDAGFVGNRTVAITANDSLDISTVNVTLFVLDTIAPQITIDSPQNITYDVIGNISLNYSVSDNYAVDSCWYSLDGGANISLAGCANTTLVDVPNGGHSLVVYVNDTGGNENSSSVDFTVDVNYAPSISALTLAPVTAYTVDDLVCNFTIVDGEQSALTAYWEWLNNSVSFLTGFDSVSNGTSFVLTLEAGNTTKGENWTCKIIPNDGTVNGTSQSISRIISNSIPVVTTISGLSWAENTDQDLNLSVYFSDNDNDLVGYTYPSIENITITVDNSTGNATFSPDIDWTGTRSINFTAWDDESANVTSNNFVLGVGLSTIVDSWIDSIFYPTGQYSDIPGIFISTINISNIIGPTINVKDSYIYHSLIIDSPIDNCVILDSMLEGTACKDAYIDPSDVKYSNTTGSSITNSHIWYSDATYSVFTNATVDNSSVSYSDVNNTIIYLSSVNSSVLEDSGVNNSVFENMTLISSNATNLTATNSFVLNSELLDTVLDNANVTDGVIYSGTILMANGTVYNATQDGQQNLTELVNYAPIAIISSPTGGTFYVGDSISFVSGSTDANIGTSLNDSLVWLWDFDDGTNSTSESASHSYSSAGTFTIVLTATDSYSKSNSANVSISVQTKSTGGGGRSRTVDRSIVLIESGVAKDLSKSSYVTFTFEGVQHKVALIEIYASFVKIKVESEPVFAYVGLEDEAKFDLNEDGYYDLKIVLNELSATKAGLVFYKISEKITEAEEEEEVSEAEEEELEEAEEETEEEVEEEEEEKENFFVVTGKAIAANVTGNYKIYGVISGYIILIVAIVVLFLKLNRLAKIVKKRR